MKKSVKVFHGKRIEINIRPFRISICCASLPRQKNETNTLFNEKYLQNSIKTHKFSQIAYYAKVVYPKTPRFHD